MTVSTLRPASSASTTCSWPGRKSSKPKISFRIWRFELRLASSRFIKLVPEIGVRACAPCAMRAEARSLAVVGRGRERHRVPALLPVVRLYRSRTDEIQYGLAWRHLLSLSD